MTLNSHVPVHCHKGHLSEQKEVLEKDGLLLYAGEEKEGVKWKQ